MSNRDEAVYRSVIGRSYYASFLEVREYLASKGIVSLGNPHSIACSQIRRFNPRIEHDLRRLRFLRNCADYEIVFPRPNLPRQSALALRLATQIIAAIDVLP